MLCLGTERFGVRLGDREVNRIFPGIVFMHCISLRGPEELNCELFYTLG